MYLDTAVFGGCFDEGFRQPSLAVIEMIGRGEVIAVISDILVAELNDAPDFVVDMLEGIPNNYKEMIHSDSQSESLRDAYIEAGALGQASAQDGHHVALASLAGVDAILSWNFKHIVNLNRIRRFHEVNRAWGLPQIEIRSPFEVGDAN